MSITKVLVTDKNNNPSSIDGVSVVELDKQKSPQKDAVVLIEVSGNVKRDIQHKLRERGFNRIIPIMKMESV